MIELKAIDPVLLHIGFIEIRWYSLAYIIGIVIGILGIKKYLKLPSKIYDDLLFWITVGIILGGRIGYVLFYNIRFYLADPLEIIKLWHGGMSFHGGLSGVLISLYITCKRHKLSFLKVGDVLACFAGIGLFLGRLANFINGELYGRVTTLPWGVLFHDRVPRHPSQLYEAILEGLLPAIVMPCLLLFTNYKKHSGLLSGIMLSWYGAARIFVECFREPDKQIGYILTYFTLGQIFSVPVLLGGIWLIYYSIRNTSYTSEK